MVKNFIWVFCLIGTICSCTPNRKLLKDHDFAAVIRNSIERLDCDAKDPKASNMLVQTYAQAISYYQNQIDLILTGNDPFRWTKTLDIMEKTNELSEYILYNSSAFQFICDPKIYRHEMKDVSSKAAQELYLQGVNCLKQGSKEKAKEACDYFNRTNQLKPKYKDVEQKISEATRQATIKIIIEKIPVTYQNNLLGLSTETFYHCLFYLLRKRYPANEFVAFYSPEEAQRQNIDHPDYSIQIEIDYFEIESRYIAVGYSKPHYSEYNNTSGYRNYPIPIKNVRKPVGPPDNCGPFMPNKFMIQLLVSGHSILKINNLHEYKVVFKKKIPANYTEDLNSDVSSEIGPFDLLANSNSQKYFDRFALSMDDKVVLQIANFFEDPINISAVP